MPIPTGTKESERPTTRIIVQPSQRQVENCMLEKVEEELFAPSQYAPSLPEEKEIKLLELPPDSSTSPLDSPELDSHFDPVVCSLPESQWKDFIKVRDTQ